MADDEPTVGIVIEMPSSRSVLGKLFLGRWQIGLAHFTNCVVLPRGFAVDNVAGLKFIIEAGNPESRRENEFSLEWDRILEVRSIQTGEIIFRNRNLCPRCLFISKTRNPNDDNRKPMFCTFCKEPF